MFVWGGGKRPTFFRFVRDEMSFNAETVNIFGQCGCDGGQKLDDGSYDNKWEWTLPDADMRGEDRSLRHRDFRPIN